MINAFSREGAKKVYVQHRLRERAKEVNELLEKKAYFYVCGDAANMAREVNTVLGQIIAEARGIPETKAEEIVKSMRAANQYQVRFCTRIFAFSDFGEVEESSLTPICRRTSGLEAPVDNS